jgi:F-type H+-transporting ATPase subunit epsilon
MPLHLEIVTPERLAYEDDVDMVIAPGIEGELGILPHHAPLITTLGVMAETADLASDIDLEKAQAARREAERALEGAANEPADLAAARAQLQQALLRIRVAERRHREGPRHRG